MLFKLIINLGTFLLFFLLSYSALMYLGVGLMICLTLEVVGFVLWEKFFLANIDEI